MTEILLLQLKQAIEAQHGGKASFVQRVRVRETFGDENAWDGVVFVFVLDDHPKASLAYAWSRELPDGERHIFSELRIPPIESPLEAVRAAVVAKTA